MGKVKSWEEKSKELWFEIESDVVDENGNFDRLSFRISLEQYAQEYFSSHFVEAVIKCIPGGPYWDVSDKILSAFNKLILENAERLVNEKQ